VPEDLALILNDSSLFSNSADITTKEILKRYGDRAKAPTINVSHHPPGSSMSSANNGTTSPTPVVTRVDTDPHMQTAWQNESSVRHVGSDRTDGGYGGAGWQGGGGAGTPSTLPYANPRSSQESHESPNRRSIRAGTFDKQRAMGIT